MPGVQVFRKYIQNNLCKPANNYTQWEKKHDHVNRSIKGLSQNTTFTQYKSSKDTYLNIINTRIHKQRYTQWGKLESFLSNRDRDKGVYFFYTKSTLYQLLSRWRKRKSYKGQCRKSKSKLPHHGGKKILQFKIVVLSHEKTQICQSS